MLYHFVTSLEAVLLGAGDRGGEVGASCIGRSTLLFRAYRVIDIKSITYTKLYFVTWEQLFITSS